MQPIFPSSSARRGPRGTRCSASPDTRAERQRARRDKRAGIKTRTKGRRRRRGAQTWALLLAAPLALASSGCNSNLQRSYVEAMVRTKKAIDADVKAGIYKPDANSQRTLDGWDKANADALAALKAEDK